MNRYSATKFVVDPKTTRRHSHNSGSLCPHATSIPPLPTRLLWPLAVPALALPLSAITTHIAAKFCGSPTPTSFLRAFLAGPILSCPLLWRIWSFKTFANSLPGNLLDDAWSPRCSWRYVPMAIVIITQCVWWVIIATGNLGLLGLPFRYCRCPKWMLRVLYLMEDGLSNFEHGREGFFGIEVCHPRWVICNQPR